MAPQSLRSAAVVNVGSLLVVVSALAVGQFLFKQAATALRGVPFLNGLASLLRSPSLYGAFLLYGLAAILWVWILSRVPLAQAYPWMASSVVIVPLLAWKFLGEQLSPTFWPGLVLIFIGLLLTQISAAGG